MNTESFRKHAAVLLIFALCAVITLFYAPSLMYGFLPDWDDGQFILENSRLDFTWSNILFYAVEPFHDLCTPVPFWSFMFDRAVAGLNPVVFHTHNLLIHLAAAVFLFLTFREAGIRQVWAFAGALFWACHLQRIESVAWIAERKDVDCALFVFSAFFFLLRDIRHDKVPLTAAVLGGISFFCKPAAAFLPFAMIFAAWMIKGKTWSVKTYFRKLSVPVMLQIFLLFTVWRITMHTNPGKIQTDLTVPLVNFCRYVVYSFYPFELNPVYPPGWRFSEIQWALMLFPVLIFLLIFCTWKAGFRQGQIFAGIIFLAGTAFPVLGLWNYTAFDFCDRYSLLISAVITGFAIMILSKIQWKTHIPGILCSLLIALHLCQGFAYLPFWADTPRLITFALEQNPRASRAALSAGVSAGLRNSNLPLLQFVSDSMNRNMAELAKTSGKPDSVQGGKAFADAHIAQMRGNTSEYVKQTFTAWHYTMQSGVFYWETLEKTLCRDMIFACRYTGNEADARRLEQKLKSAQVL